MLKFKGKGILLLLVVALMSFSALFGCNSSTESSSSQGGLAAMGYEEPDKYEYEGISVDVITAVVGDREFTGAINDGSDTTRKNTAYLYNGLTESDLDTYGEYLLQSGFEEIQTDCYSISNSDGATMKITLSSNGVTVEGEVHA